MAEASVLDVVNRAEGLRALARPFGPQKDRQPASFRETSPLDRVRIIESLGVDPADTPQDSRISIMHCASHSPALRPERLEAMLRARRDRRSADTRSRLPH